MSRDDGKHIFFIVKPQIVFQSTKFVNGNLFDLIGSCSWELFVHNELKTTSMCDFEYQMTWSPLQSIKM